MRKLEKERTALIIVDVQNDFCKVGGWVHKRGDDVTPVLEMIPRLKKFLNELRTIGVFVIHVKTIHADYTDAPTWEDRFKGIKPQVCKPGSWGAEIVTELEPLAGEPVVIKHRYSPFHNTDLDLILRSKGISNIIVTGTMTNVCVQLTAEHGFMFDYYTITVSDCVATADKAAGEASLKNLQKYFGYVVESASVIDALR
jgi:ureidoacrylate peracid hydrolase